MKKSQISIYVLNEITQLLALKGFFHFMPSNESNVTIFFLSAWRGMAHKLSQDINLIPKRIPKCFNWNYIPLSWILNRKSLNENGPGRQFEGMLMPFYREIHSKRTLYHFSFGESKRYELEIHTTSLPIHHFWSSQYSNIFPSFLFFPNQMALHVEFIIDFHSSFISE